jgi:hypothetical protein
MIDEDGHFLPWPRRRDPRPGDVVRSTDALGTHRFRVISVDGGIVRYWSIEEEVELCCSVEEWRRYAENDVILLTLLT